MSATPAPRRGLLRRVQPEQEPEPEAPPPLPVRGPDPSRPRVPARWPGRASELRRTQVLAHDEAPRTSAEPVAPPWRSDLAERARALLSSLVEESPDGATALLGTADGLPVTAHGISSEDAVRQAALIASLHAVAASLHAEGVDEDGLGTVTVSDGRRATVVRRVPAATLGHPLLAVTADETALGELLVRMRSVCLELAEAAG